MIRTDLLKKIFWLSTSYRY